MSLLGDFSPQIAIGNARAYLIEAVHVRPLQPIRKHDEEVNGQVLPAEAFKRSVVSVFALGLAHGGQASPRALFLAR